MSWVVKNRSANALYAFESVYRRVSNRPHAIHEKLEATIGQHTVSRACSQWCRERFDHYFHPFFVVPCLAKLGQRRIVFVDRSKNREGEVGGQVVDQE